MRNPGADEINNMTGGFMDPEEAEFIISGVLVAEAVDAQEKTVEDLRGVDKRQTEEARFAPSMKHTQVRRAERTAAHQRVAQRGADVHHALRRYRQAREGSPAFADEFVGSTTAEEAERKGWERG